jgi:hypothetical protein
VERLGTPKVWPQSGSRHVGALALRGRRRIQEAWPLVSEQATASVKEDVEVARDQSTIRTDIERERRELGETVAALAETADVKGHAHRKISETRGTTDRKREQVLADGQHVAGVDDERGASSRRTIAIGAAAIALAVVLARRRRR